MYDNSTL